MLELLKYLVRALKCSKYICQQQVACFCGVIRSSLPLLLYHSHSPIGMKGNGNTFYSDCVLPNRGALASLDKLQALRSLSF